MSVHWRSYWLTTANLALSLTPHICKGVASPRAPRWNCPLKWHASICSTAPRRFWCGFDWLNFWFKVGFRWTILKHTNSRANCWIGNIDLAALLRVIDNVLGWIFVASLFCMRVFRSEWINCVLPSCRGFRESFCVCDCDYSQGKW